MLLLVGIAGLFGVVARYLISSPFHGDALPWVTIGINVAGSLVLGILVSSHTFSQDFRTGGRGLRLLLRPRGVLNARRAVPAQLAHPVRARRP